MATILTCPNDSTHGTFRAAWNALPIPRRLPVYTAKPGERAKSIESAFTPFVQSFLAPVCTVCGASGAYAESA